MVSKREPFRPGNSSLVLNLLVLTNSWSMYLPGQLMRWHTIIIWCMANKLDILQKPEDYHHNRLVLGAINNKSGKKPCPSECWLWPATYSENPRSAGLLVLSPIFWEHPPSVRRTSTSWEICHNWCACGYWRILNDCWYPFFRINAW